MGAFPSAIKRVVFSVGGPPTAALGWRGVPTGEQGVHVTAVGVRFPNGGGIVDLIHDHKPEVVAVGRKEGIGHSSRGGDKLPRVGAVVVGDINVISVGKQQLSIGRPGTVAAGYISHGAG